MDHFSFLRYLRIFVETLMLDTSPQIFNKTCTNGLAEKMVQTLNKYFYISKSSLQDTLDRYLFNYRLTPHTSTSISPAELILGRRLRSKLCLRIVCRLELQGNNIYKREITLLLLDHYINLQTHQWWFGIALLVVMSCLLRKLFDRLVYYLIDARLPQEILWNLIWIRLLLDLFHHPLSSFL